MRVDSSTDRRSLATKISAPAFETVVGHSNRWRYLAKFGLILLGLTALFLWSPVSLPATGYAWLLLGFLFSLLSYVLYALRFRVSLAAVGVAMGSLQTVRLNSFATFCQFFVPLSVGADLTRFALCRDLDPKHRGLRCAGGIIVDHCTGLLTALLIGAALSYTVIPPLPTVTQYAQMIVAALGVLSVVTGVWVWRRRARRSHYRLGILLRTRWRNLMLGIGFSLAMQLTLAGAVFVGSVEWHNSLTYSEVLWVLACGSVMQLVPINVAGITVGDAAGVGLYVALGLAMAEALQLVALFYVYRLSVAIIGGLWQLIPERPKSR